MNVWTKLTQNGYFQQKTEKNKNHHWILHIWIRGGSRDFEKGWGALYVGHWLADEKNFKFQMVWKGRNKVKSYKFLTKYFYQYFQILPFFTYNKSLMVKSYQLFRFYKRFYKEREKTLQQQSMRIIKTEKSWTLLYYRLFCKAL